MTERKDIRIRRREGVFLVGASVGLCLEWMCEWELVAEEDRCFVERLGRIVGTVGGFDG